MPLIQPMRLPAGTGQPDLARPAAHCPAPAQDAIGDRLVITELDVAPIASIRVRLPGTTTATQQRCRTAVRARRLVAPGYRCWPSGFCGCPPDGGGRQAELLPAEGLSGGACDVGGDNIGRVPVQAAAGPVISHRGPRVRMGGGFLHVAQRDPGIQLAVMNACRSV